MKFLGSGFGGKLWPWTHGTLAAAAARKLGRPVKLVVTRKQMFETLGHRARTQQRVRMSAQRNGTLTSLRHEAVNEASMLDEYDENCGEATPYFYGTPNLLVTSAQTRRNVGSPTAMRGPGAVPGLFATESAYDELAIELGIDPVQLRLHNEPERDQSLDVPFSSRHYAECLTVGSQKFGWSQRSPAVGSMRKGDVTLGWGMSGCSWIAGRFAAEARVELHADGSARVRSERKTSAPARTRCWPSSSPKRPASRSTASSSSWGHALAARTYLRRLASDVLCYPGRPGGGAGRDEIGDRSRDDRAKAAL